MGIANGIDRLLRAMGSAPLQGSLAGEPGLSALPDTDVPVPLPTGDAGADGREATHDDLDEAERAPAPVEPTSAQTLPASSASAAEILDGTSTDGSGTAAATGLAGELVTAAAAAEVADAPVALDAHALARLEAASDLVESLGLGFHLGGAVERIVRGASEGKTGLEALREASWLIERYIALVEERPIGADLHSASVRLNRAGEAIAGLRAISIALEAERTPGRVLPVDDGTSAAAPVDAEPPPPADREPPPASEPVTGDRSFGFEVALMAVRWSIMVLAVIAVVLAVTLIGDWL